MKHYWVPDRILHIGFSNTYYVCKRCGLYMVEEINYPGIIRRKRISYDRIDYNIVHEYPTCEEVQMESALGVKYV